MVQLFNYPQDQQQRVEHYLATPWRLLRTTFMIPRHGIQDAGGNPRGAKIVPIQMGSAVLLLVDQEACTDMSSTFLEAPPVRSSQRPRLNIRSEDFEYMLVASEYSSESMSCSPNLFFPWDSNLCVSRCYTHTEPNILLPSRLLLPTMVRAILLKHSHMGLFSFS